MAMGSLIGCAMLVTALSGSQSDRRTELRTIVQGLTILRIQLPAVRPVKPLLQCRQQCRAAWPPCGTGLTKGTMKSHISNNVRYLAVLRFWDQCVHAALRSSWSQSCPERTGADCRDVSAHSSLFAVSAATLQAGTVSVFDRALPVPSVCTCTTTADVPRSVHLCGDARLCRECSMLSAGRTAGLHALQIWSAIPCSVAAKHTAQHSAPHSLTSMAAPAGHSTVTQADMHRMSCTVPVCGHPGPPDTVIDSAAQVA